MACKGFSSFTGCGECFVAFNNKQIVSTLDSSCLSDILCDIMDVFKTNPNSNIDLLSSTVSCTGDTDILYTLSPNPYNLHKVVMELVPPWYKYNEQYINQLTSTLYILNLVQAFKDPTIISINNREIDKFSHILQCVDEATKLPLIF